MVFCRGGSRTAPAEKYKLSNTGCAAPKKKHRRMRVFTMRTLFVLAIILIIGCQISAAESKQFPCDLRISNTSSIKIYPVLSSGKHNEDFRVVAIGKSATIGFSPFKIGDVVTVQWEEGESNEKKKVSFDTKKLSKIEKELQRLNFIYQGNGKWILKAITKNGEEIITP